MKKDLYVVIMAGGKGERFWPLSTPENPKPFLNFFSERSLLQQTYDRAKKLVPAKQIFLIVGEKHGKLSKQQLPELPASHLLLEPSGRDTAAAIGYASLHLPDDALMLVMPADHLIPEPENFVNTVKNAAEFMGDHGGPATFGVHPTRPETNYGYIKATDVDLGRDGFPIFQVERFIEKPNRVRASKFVKQASYYWNSGIFLWSVSRIQQLIGQHLPELWDKLQRLRKWKPNSPAFRRAYAELPRISIDFGVMEKADQVVVVPAKFGWDDIGTWTSLLRVLPVDTQGNLVRGKHTGLDSSDCIIYAESHTIATAGIEGLIVVQRGNQTLICSKKYADRLKELLAQLPSN